MVSIGDNATVGRLVCDELKIKGETHSHSKKIGADPHNQCELQQIGSIFYFKYSVYHQIQSFTTIDTSQTVRVVLDSNVEHGLVTGDVVTIENSVIFENVDINGIMFSEISGPHYVSIDGLASSNYSFNMPNISSQATSTGSVESITPLVRIDRYKYIDMASTSNIWQSSTQIPTIEHENTESFNL